VIEVADSILAKLPELRAALPVSVDLNVMLDTTTSIRNAVHDVEMTLILSTLLVILVVFLFLRNFKATLVPTVCVPLSLLGTFGVMYLLGFSLDNFSLMALIVSTGFVVDNTIVVLENVTRHLENGEDRMTGRTQGRARGQLHGAVHEHLAGGGVLPGAADWRHGRAHLPRIRHDPDHRDHHVTDRVADRDPDDVRLS
jgi:multidrug efflux pump subunit AcrB